MNNKNFKKGALTGFFAIFLAMQPIIVLADVVFEQQVNVVAPTVADMLRSTDAAPSQVEASTPDDGSSTDATLSTRLTKNLQKAASLFDGVNWKQAGVTAASVAAVLAVYDVVKR